MNHYVYRITNLIESKHYYGVRSSKISPKDDLGNYYFSSSCDKNFLKDQKENPQNYKYKIIKCFNTRKHANKYEIKLHKKFNVGINEAFYNLASQTSEKFNFKVTSEIAKKSAVTMSKIQDDGLTIRERATIKMKETKKLSNKCKGKNNYQAKKINIYDNNGNLRFECHGDVKHVCRDNDIPFRYIRRSYQTNKPITFKYNCKYSEFEGWSAKDLSQFS